MKSFKLFSFITILLIFAISCQLSTELVDQSDKNLSVNSSEARSSAENELKIIKDTGIIYFLKSNDKYNPGEWLIRGKLNVYKPLNLPKPFHQNRLKVKFTAYVLNTTSSVIKKVLDIKIISMVTTELKEQLVFNTGVIREKFIQGHPWLIESSTGTYQVINLPDELKKPGLKVIFTGKIRPDIIIIPPLWPIMEIISIRPLNPDLIPVELGEKFKLPIYRTAVVKKDKVFLTFKDVLLDSRCPIEVNCIWPGEAVILVNVKIGDVSYGDFKMTTLDRPSVIYVGGYMIEFSEIYPFASIKNPIDKDDYVAVFQINRIWK